MCLLKTHWLPKISRKPIQVYKVFSCNMDAKGNVTYLVTPYQRTFHKLGEVIKARHSWIRGVFRGEITGEGVHAAADKREAELFLIGIESFLSPRGKISVRCRCSVYSCEIPPYTPYWIGNYGDIAASKMIIKERVQL